MRRRIGRRALFFGLIALICLALVPAMPNEFRWVAWASAVLAGFWAVMFAVEDLLGAGGRAEKPVIPEEQVPIEPETPFGPPPPPRAARR